ncbi:hypothetical protein [Aeromonas salmonicida]|uniref:hypothetical protein n=1 Tax=Aeromonas salmonicida TaxID=645 RepID=UPI001BA556A3|nr:hypothetical protein [Aeromonas salmonicida]MBS2780638.1 hypothetical protein [Aeromonas salmonicida]
MKKTLIALAIAGLSFNAAAVVDLNASPVVPAKFASEFKFDTTDGSAVANTGNVYDAKVKVGFSISANNQRYVRFDITGAEFANAGVLAATMATQTGTPFSATISSSGKTFVIFEIKDAEDVITKDDVLTYAPSIVAKGANAVNLTYKLFETAVAAVANDTAQALENRSGTIISFTPALAAKFTPVTPNKIDVSAESKQFETVATINTVGKLAVGVNSDVLWPTGGVQTTMANLVTTGSKVEVTADLSAGKKQAADATKIDATALTLGVAPANTIDATKATFDLVAALGDVTSLPAVTYADLVLTVDGKTAINETSFVGKYVVTAATNSTATDLPFGTLSDLKKNGAEAELNIALKPAGAYKNYVRISNKSGMKGDFFVTVTADDGKNVTFPLSAVANQPAALEAGASTTQMMVDDVFAAAAAKGLSLAADGKLRIKVEGQVPAGKISLQSYTLSKDGNSFATMNAF